MDSVELEKRVETIVEAAGFRLMEANWEPIKGRLQLRVVADAEDHSITIKECADLSHAISDLLDSYPHEFPDYRLEVSSPGLKHPLERWQFHKNLGRTVEVRYEVEAVRRTFKGNLEEIDEEGFKVDDGNQLQRFDFEQVGEVFVLPSLSKNRS